MKTRGTADLHRLSDNELRHLIVNAALDIHEASLYGLVEFQFAIGTFDRFREELLRREREPAEEFIQERIVFDPDGFWLERVQPTGEPA